MFINLENNKRETYSDGIKLCLQIINKMIDDNLVNNQNVNQLRQASKNIIDNI